MRDDLPALARTLRSLHRRGAPLVLPNAWDVASARAVVDAGYPVVATSSAAVARALGYGDHEAMPADEAFGVVRRIASAVDVPVTADIEAGYGLPAAEIVDRLLDAGAVGCNLEDTAHPTDDLRDTTANADHLASVRDAASQRGVDIVINARVDVFRTDPDSLERLDEGIARGRAYMGAGADCTYPILLADAEGIRRYVDDTAAPVNIFLRPGTPSVGELRELGVKRVSVAAGLFRAAQAGIADALTRLGESGRL
jgi:2-methylisocitrate lyase-like PEP mutase family enzyme